MKVYPDKLIATIKKASHRIFIISGDEPLLVQENCDLVRRGLKSQGFTERELFHAETGFDWDSVLYSNNSLSLFAEKKLIEIRLPSGKPGDSGGAALAELVAGLGDDTALLLVLPRLDQKIQRAKWFKQVEPPAAFVQIWPIENRELPGWLEARFHKAGLKITRDAVRAMAERIEGNLLAAVQEIERLKLVVGKGQVDIDDINASVADSSRYDVFKLIDACLAGDLNRCVRMTNGLKAEGVEPLFVVNMLVRELRSLETMKVAIRGGAKQAEVFRKARVWDKRAPIVSKCLDRHELAAVRQMLLSLGLVDRVVKGLATGDAWRELQDVVLQLGGARTLARIS